MSISLEMTCSISIKLLLLRDGEDFINYRVSCKSCQIQKKICLDTLYKGFNKNCVCLLSGKAKVLSKKKKNRFLPTTSSAKYGCCLNIQKVHSMRESQPLSQVCTLCPAQSKRYRESSTSTDSISTIATSTKLVAVFVLFSDFTVQDTC